MMTGSLKDILLSANATLDPVQAKQMYKHVRDISRNNSELLYLYITATRELAYLSSDIQIRSSLWKDAYSRIFKMVDHPDVEYIEQAAILLNNIILDKYSGLDLNYLSAELGKFDGVSRHERAPRR